MEVPTRRLDQLLTSLGDKELEYIQQAAASLLETRRQSRHLSPLSTTASKKGVLLQICTSLTVRDAIPFAHVSRALRDKVQQASPVLKDVVGLLSLQRAVEIQRAEIFKIGALTLKKGDDLKLMPLLTSLESAVFADNFNETLETMVLPDSLKTLKFGMAFNQSLHTVSLPMGLEILVFGYMFNQSMESVSLPSSLQRLEFGTRFNNSITSLPANLLSLSFSSEFTQSLSGVQLPCNLQKLILGSESARSLADVALPESLPALSILEVDSDADTDDLICSVEMNVQRMTFKQSEYPCPLCGGRGTLI